MLVVKLAIDDDVIQVASATRLGGRKRVSADQQLTAGELCMDSLLIQLTSFGIPTERIQNVCKATTCYRLFVQPCEED